MVNLDDAADAAYPPNYSSLPKSITVFLGYAGGTVLHPAYLVPFEGFRLYYRRH